MVRDLMGLTGYRVLEELAETRDRVVVRAVREGDGRSVILKSLRMEFPPRRHVARLRQELEMTRDLDAAVVVRAMCLEESGGRVVLVLEDTGGTSLRHLLRGRPMAPDCFLDIAVSVARALQAVHQHGLIHLDIKPHNIIVDRGGGTARITDFGIASRGPQASQPIRPANELQGTLAYMSPEQTGRMNRSVDYRSDFYSLGVTFYEMLTGCLPFQATDAIELVHCHIAREPIPPAMVDASIPAALSSLVMKLLSKTAEDRYQSDHGLLWDLEACRDALRHGRPLHSFEPGRMDVPSLFHLPQRLYGRASAVAELMTAFDRAVEGATELLLVAGQPGVGKSALIQEVHKPIVRERGYVMSGKFDQLARSVPYSALISAVADVVGQLLTESPERVREWRSELLEAVGPNAQLLTDVIPRLELLLGPSPQQTVVSVLGPAESQYRFNLVFQQFIRVFAQSGHPLVIFLDDLQWADPATLKLLASLVSDPGTHHLFIIGAYRDTEVNPAHPLDVTLAELRQNGSPVRHLKLEPLTAAEVLDLTADCLHGEPATAAPLAELIWTRTGGNPFFVRQLLAAFHRDGLINYDATAGRWTCDVGTVTRLGLTDDVVDFLLGEVRRLPSQTRAALATAGCIGNSFELGTLARILEQSPERVEDDLLESIRTGLLVADGESDYRFVHDRVQQAVSRLLPDEDRRKTHLRIGRRLLEETGQERLFDTVRHLNEAVDLLEPDARRRLAELNLQAGVRARDTGAFEATRGYLEMAAGLLPDNAWTDEYELAFPIYKGWAEAQFVCGQPVAAADRLEDVRRHVRNRLDGAAVCLIQVEALVTLTRMQEAIDVGLAGLSAFGLHLPLQPEGAELSAELQRARVLRGRRSIRSLADGPVMDDPELLAQVHIMDKLLPPLYVMGNPNLMALAVLKIINLSLLHGNADSSTFAYTVYGFVLAGGTGDYASSDAFGAMALRLAERLQCPQFLSRTHHCIAAYVAPWTQPYRIALALAGSIVRYRPAVFCMSFEPYLEFFRALTLAWLSAEPGEDLLTTTRRFQAWSRLPPPQYRLMHLLLRAEMARLRREARATDLYDAAVRAARHAGNMMFEGISNELAARHHQARGHAVIAAAYRREAHYAYTRWGAKAKVAHLEARHPHLQSASVPTLNASVTTTTVEAGARLDVATMLRASQAMAGEMDTPGVVRRLIRVLMENAGADRVVLLLAPHLQAEGAEAVPAGLVRYVERTREPLVIEDARTAPRFSNDPYVIERQPRSVLCAPLLNQGHLVGVVYLENSLTAGAFTVQRLDLVRVLSAQAAIALENARLYEGTQEHGRTLEQKVAERTVELQEKNVSLAQANADLRDLQGQIILQEKLAYLGTLTAGIAHEIMNPLSLTNSFASLSMDMVAELRSAVNAVESRLERSDRDAIQDHLDTLGSCVRKVQENAERITGIVRSMLMHSGATGGEARPTDFNELVDRAVRLAVHSSQADQPAVESRLQPDLPRVSVNVRDLSRVVVNLVTNALHAVRERALSEGNGYQPRVLISTAEAGDRIELRIQDNGVGIPPAMREKIFNPFFTTRAPGQGTGLGLSISFDIIRQHRGDIRVTSEPGTFTEFIVSLPLE